MRNLLIGKEIGKEVFILCRNMENCEQDQQLQEPSKILSKVLSKDVIPLSLTLKNNMKTNRSVCIIHGAEKRLLNECIRNNNNTIDTVNKKDTCIVKNLLNPETLSI